MTWAGAGARLGPGSDLAGPTLTAPKPRNLVLDRSGPAWWGALGARRGGSGQDTHQEELCQADTQWDSVLGTWGNATSIYIIPGQGKRKWKIPMSGDSLIRVNLNLRVLHNYCLHHKQGFLVGIRNQFNCGGQISRPTIKQLIVCHSAQILHMAGDKEPRRNSKDGIPDF